MDWLEQELKNTLARKDPLWDRVVATEDEGLVAKEQVMLAFRIAAVKVNHIQTHIQQAAR